MDLLTLIQAVIRRWYVTVPVLLATFAVAAVVQANITPEYQANGSVLLEEPRFDPSRLPASFINAGAIADRFDELDAGARFSTGDAQVVVHAATSTTIEILGVGPAANDVAASVDAAIEWVRDEVAAMQDEEDVAASERLRSTVLTPVVTPEPLPGGSYEAVGIVALRDPSSGIENPYGADSSTTSLLGAVVTSDTGRSRVNQATASGVTFGVSTGRDNPAIVSITTTGPDPDGVVDAFDVVRDALADELDARQARAEVPESRRIVVSDLARPEAVADVSPPVSRAVAAVVGAGGLLALGLAIVVDTVALRRRSRRSGERGPNLLPGRTEKIESAGVTATADTSDKEDAPARWWSTVPSDPAGTRSEHGS